MVSFLGGVFEKRVPSLLSIGGCHLIQVIAKVCTGVRVLFGGRRGGKVEMGGCHPL